MLGQRKLFHLLSRYHLAFFIFPGQQTSTHLSSRRSRRGANHLTRVHLRKLRERYGATATAKSVLIRDDSVDHLRDQIFRELLTYMMENSAVVYPVFELNMVAGRDVRHLAADRRYSP